jgi:signal transduction histidine kinase
LVSAPLYAHERTLAVLIIAVSAEPSQSDLEALHLVTAQAAATLENVDLFGEISRAYVNARELERLKSEFINIAGHELRTPLAVLLGYGSLLREKLDGELQSYASEVVTHAQRLQQIADDMLSLKHLEDGHVELRLERCAIEQVVREVVTAYRPLAREREQSIELELAAQTGNVTADRAMLDLMLGSLISNAIKFSPRQTRVRVSVQGDDRQVTLQVRDQGKGLTSEQAAQVFDAFYQAGSSLTRAEGGLGLGLTITREMVRAHGGKIWVESEHSGGSSFYISLPRENARVR